MGTTLNKVILIGYLGQDPEDRSLPNGTACTKISIGMTESWKDKATGKTVEKTEWMKVVFYSALAEIASKYLRKGSLVYVEGKFTSYKFTDKQGVERTITEVISNEMKMLSKQPEVSVEF